MRQLGAQFFGRRFQFPFTFLLIQKFWFFIQKFQFFVQKLRVFILLTFFFIQKFRVFLACSFFFIQKYRPLLFLPFFVFRKRHENIGFQVILSVHTTFSGQTQNWHRKARRSVFTANHGIRDQKNSAQKTVSGSESATALRMPGDCSGGIDTDPVDWGRFQSDEFYG